MARGQTRRTVDAPQVLVILDMISEFDFQNAEKFLPTARRVARAIATLKQRACAAGIPVVYVNDTSGKWESDPAAFIDRCARPGAKASDIATLLRPQRADYFIFKPRHSAFYETPFQTLLQRLQVRHLVLTGMTSHQCVLFTAMDAHVREYRLTVPSDCIGAHTSSATRHASFILKEALNARVVGARSVRWR